MVFTKDCINLIKIDREIARINKELSNLKEKREQMEKKVQEYIKQKGDKSLCNIPIKSGGSLKTQLKKGWKYPKIDDKIVYVSNKLGIDYEYLQKTFINARDELKTPHNKIVTVYKKK